MRPQGLIHDVPDRGRRVQRIRRPTAWIRISSRIHEHPDVAGLPSDASRWAWVVVLCEAKNQPEPGSFRSTEHLGKLLGWRLARQVPHLLAAGLLEPSTDGSRPGAVEVHNWRRWQSAAGLDRTAAERQRRYRERVRDQVTALRHGVTAEGLSRVTHGGPPLQGYQSSTVTPAIEGVVTGTVGNKDHRRELATAIRDAPSEYFRRRFMERFDRTYGHLYPSQESRP